MAEQDQNILKLLQWIEAGNPLSPTVENYLRNQTELSLNGRTLRRLPDTIRLMTSLVRLDLNGTQITKLPESIGQLVNLMFLDLSNTQITCLPTSIKNLQYLSDLRLSNSNLQTLPDTVRELTNLTILDLTQTKLRVLPNALCDLSKLQLLHLNGVRITELPESIGALQALQGLYLGWTALTKLPESLSRLENLERLYLNDTKLTSLPDWIGSLPKLKRLDLRGLTLPKIPKSLALYGLPFVDLDHFGYGYLGINLHGVTLTEQSLSVFLETPLLIPSLYREQTALRECKVIFLGDGDSGKTYTIRRFRNEGLPEGPGLDYQTSETPGVEILDYSTTQGSRGKGFTIHFWDFGGQQLLHSMHRCFLTEQSCYVVTVKTRETRATQRARYWLQNVKAFAPHSPIILYVNCWGNDDGRRSIDEPRLLQDFSQIKKVVYCSAKNATQQRFRKDFMEPLLKLLKESNLLQQTVNSHWNRLQQSIQSENRDYLSRQQYLALCKKCGVKNADAADLLTYFNNLGVCFSYHRDRDCRESADYKLLRPVWLTNALYAVIQEGSAYAQGGILNRDAIQTMLAGRGPNQVRKKSYHRTVPELTYRTEECQYILDVAAAYNLCYEAEPGKLFFPSLCKADSPPEALKPPTGYPHHVIYQLQYTYLPDSVVHRLMIRCRSRELVVRDCWLRGMVLAAMEAHRAVIRMENDETLQIDLYSKPEHPAWEAFHLIREEILTVNAALNLPQPREFILDGEDRFAVNGLFGALRGAGLVYGPTTGNERNAAELLGQFYTDWSLQQLQVEKKQLVMNIPHKIWHHCQKSDPVLRKALFAAYRGICPYCKRSFSSEREFEVDHILPTHFDAVAHPELKEYLAYLKASGFDTDKPDYVENYFPAHSSCNRDKSNRINLFTLPAWHELAARTAPRVLELMERSKI